MKKHNLRIAFLSLPFPLLNRPSPCFFRRDYQDKKEKKDLMYTRLSFLRQQEVSSMKKVYEKGPKEDVLAIKSI